MVITFWGLSRNFAVVHQNRKDPMREIQRCPNLGHNLCENDKQSEIFITDGSLQVSKKL